MTDAADHFGQWMSAKCEREGLTRPLDVASALHDATGLFVHPSTVSRWMSGTRSPARNWWPALSILLGVELSEMALRANGFDPVNL